MPIYRTAPFFARDKEAIMDKREADYWRGYGVGVYFRIRQRMGESIREHYRLPEEATGENGYSYVDAYARGYRDGCKEKTPCLVLAERDQSDRQEVSVAFHREPRGDANGQAVG
jgi:hypothetical protein